MYNIDKTFGIVQIPKPAVDRGICLITLAYSVAHKNTPVYSDQDTPDCWIFECVFQGSGFLEIDGRTEHLSAGDSYILPKTGHRYRFWYDPKKPWSKLAVLATGSLLEQMIHFYQIPPRFTIHNNLQIRDIFLKIMHLAQNPETATKKSLPLFLQLFQEWDRFHQEPHPRPSEPAVKLKLWLDSMIYHKVCLRDYAIKHYISTEHLIRLFRCAYGESPYAYLTDQRLRIAGNMLQFSTEPLKSIAEKLCFSDPYHFSKAFKKYSGLPPKIFRNATCLKHLESDKSASIRP